MLAESELRAGIDQDKILSEGDKRKLRLCPSLWGIHTVFSSLGVALTSVSVPLAISTENPWILGANLLPGTLRLGSLMISERIYNVNFSLPSKCLAFWPTFGGGSAIPLEIALTLGSLKIRTLPRVIKEKVVR